MCTEIQKLMLFFLVNLLTCQKMLLVMCLIARKTKRNTSQLTSEGCLGFCLLPLSTIVVVIARWGSSCNGLVWGTDLDRWKCRHNFSWIEFWKQITKKMLRGEVEKKNTVREHLLFVFHWHKTSCTDTPFICAIQCPHVLPPSKHSVVVNIFFYFF